MCHNVSSYSLNPFRRTSDSFDPCPFALQLLLSFYLLALSHLFELNIYLRPLLWFEFQFCKPAFVIDPDRSSVVYSLLDVVSVYVFPENSRSGAVRLFYRCARKSNK